MDGLVVETEITGQEGASLPCELIFLMPTGSTGVRTLGLYFADPVAAVLQSTWGSFGFRSSAEVTRGALPGVVAIMDQIILKAPRAIRGAAACTESSSLFLFKAVDTQYRGSGADDAILDDLSSPVQSQNDLRRLMHVVLKVLARQ